MNIQELLELTITREASDLHLIDASPPTLRIQGTLVTLVTYPLLFGEEIEQMIFSLLNSTQKEVLLTNREIDFSTNLKINDDKLFRFRVNAYFQKGHMSAALRLIPDKIKTVDELSLPPLLNEFVKFRQGFILLTGGSGQGKSTTLASIINEINKTRKAHIVTIEDPIEYTYPKGKAIISQREMYQDTHSWRNALRSALREDPDIVYIGEMRDFDTISSALTIAETGHLVFSTLHTNSAAQTIDRIIDTFPATSKDQIRMQLSMVISGIVSQRLIPTIKGDRIPVCEILIGTPSIKNIIREGKIHLIDNIIQTSKDEGMILFEDHLKELVNQGIVAHETALEYALRPDRYMQLLKG